METLLLLMFFTYLYLQWHSMRNMQGGWKRASQASAWIMAAVLSVTLFAMISRSSLWPFGLLFGCPLVFIYQVILFFVWRAKGKPAG